MSANKHLEKLAWTVTALILTAAVLFMNGSALGLGVMESAAGYESRLFDNTEVHAIDILMEDWEEFIDNAESEEYYTADIVIDGEKYKNVGIRGKGNTSLSMVSSMDSDRYSFKVEFDHYDDSISYHGLDKLSLNNLIQDSTMMKDYLTYTMMNEFGVHSSLCSFAYITVNGEDWGLYLAVEGVEDSFLMRNYGSVCGELYKPDSMSMGGGRGNGREFDMDDFMGNEDSAETNGAAEENAVLPQMPGTGDFAPSQMPEDFGGTMPGMNGFDPAQMQGAMPGMNGFDPAQMQDGTTEDSDKSEGSSAFGGSGGSAGRGSSDVKLQYIDDNAQSYSNIWDNAKTDITSADQTRLIESLKKLSNGEQISSVVDIEQVIRYFVVHNYVCNGDSYTGSMVHNYYLYEENGQLAMIPWDYNLAFGTFQGGSAQSMVNTPIDSPISGGSNEDRPMWNWIPEDERCTELYHEYFKEFLDTVDIQAIIDNAYALIGPYVEKDPTAFYTFEEFETGVQALRRFCSLRTESISLQLKNGETTGVMNYADASDLTLSDMGTMGKGGAPEGFGSHRTKGALSFAVQESGASAASDTNGKVSGTSASETKTTDVSSENRPAFGDTAQNEEGKSGRTEDDAQGTEETSAEDAENSGSNVDTTDRQSRSNEKMTGSRTAASTSGAGSRSVDNKGLVWTAVSVLILFAGLLAAKLYRY